MLAAVMRRGPRFLIQYVRDSLAFDLFHGTNTHLRVPKSDHADIDAEKKDGVLYVASFTSVVRKTLLEAERILGKEEFGNAQFIDLGCGKGKALLVYAVDHAGVTRHPAIGIEYDPGLCEVARTNVAKITSGASSPAIHCDSAVNVEKYLTGDRLIVYMYNPFGGQTLRAVLSALGRHPHILIYVDPVERGLLPDLGYNICAANEGRLHADTWIVATHPGSGEASAIQTSEFARRS